MSDGNQNLDDMTVRDAFRGSGTILAVVIVLGILGTVFLH